MIIIIINQEESWQSLHDQQSPEQLHYVDIGVLLHWRMNSSANQLNHQRSAAETPSTVFQDECTPQLLLSFCDPTVEPGCPTGGTDSGFSRRLQEQTGRPGGVCELHRPQEHLFYPVFNLLIPIDQLWTATPMSFHCLHRALNQPWPIVVRRRGKSESSISTAHA